MMSPHFNTLYAFEPRTSTYTLTVLCPPRPPPRWLPAVFTRPGPFKPNTGTTYAIRPSDYNPANPNYDCFQWRHLEYMKAKTVELISDRFPADLRCEHVQDGQKCNEGCYFLEKGGHVSRWRCTREDCEGHVYCGVVKKDSTGIACFGKKGARMVCVDG